MVAVSRSCSRLVLAACHLLGVATAILLWGAAAEAFYFDFLVTAAFLLIDAVVVSLLEGAFAVEFFVVRITAEACQGRCHRCCQPLTWLDTYKRAALYIVLAVPCFIHSKVFWLPTVPGAALLLSASVYAVRHFIRERSSIVKMPTFVRFEEEAIAEQTEQPRRPPLSQQSSFASSDESGCQQMGSRDSGIEATRRDSSEGRKQRKQAKSQDKQCLLQEEELAWQV